MAVVAVAAAVAAVALVAGCGSGRRAEVERSAPAAAAGAAGPGERSPGPEHPVAAAPRWVRVAGLTGTGHQRTEPFTIGGDALQWRITATCEEGHLRLAPAGDAEALVDQACPGRFFAFSIRTGAHALEVTADGAWEVVVDQQVDHPLAEPPLPGMTERNRTAAGPFSAIEQQGEGTATLFKLPDGRTALRLEPFFVTPNDDLFVWASEAPAPTTSADAFFTPHVQLEALKATAGSQNYLLPDGLPLDRIRSIVIWCEPVRTAYAAAPLQRR